MEKKYKLTDETINVNGKTLYRIKSLKDFGNVKKGDKGGFVEKEENLSQSGDCWVYDNAKVYNNAKVFDYADIYGNTEIFGNAIVSGNARVYGNAKVYHYAMVYDNAEVCDNAIISGNAEVYHDAAVYGNARVFGNAEICGKAEIANDLDYIVFKNWWSSGRYFTWTRSNNMWKVGCFYGTSNELIEKAYRDSNESGKEYEKIVKYVESMLKDNNAVA